MAKILFLYSELMPYIEAVINYLHNEEGDEIKVVHWDHKKLTTHRNNLHDAIEVIDRSSINLEEGIRLINEFKPDIVYVSGWMDKLYLKIISDTKLKERCPVVSGMDNQWRGNKKQISQILLHNYLIRKYFTHLWVPGKRQFAFGRLLGFKNDQIISNLYAGNVNLFNQVKRHRSGKKKIIFLGRLEEVKAVDLLIQAWSKINKESYSEWELILIGAGRLSDNAKGIKKVNLAGFLKQDEMIELLSGDSSFCLPSRREPWGVVVHEMAAAGLPLILSKTVGAGDEFLINNFNGFLMTEVTVQSIKFSLEKMMNLSYEEREVMSIRSKVLSSRITPEISAASLKSVLKKVVK